MDNLELKQYYLDFLKKHQPMPPDQEADDEDLDTYCETVDFFMEDLSKECIPLFLNSFGKDTDCGIYSVARDVICQFSKDDVLEHLLEVLSNTKGNTSYHIFEICGYYPCKELLFYFEELLYEKDFKLKDSILGSLSFFNVPEVKLPEVKDTVIRLFDYAKQENNLELLNYIKQEFCQYKSLSERSVELLYKVKDSTLFELSLANILEPNLPEVKEIVLNLSNYAKQKNDLELLGDIKKEFPNIEI